MGAASSLLNMSQYLQAMQPNSAPAPPAPTSSSVTPAGPPPTVQPAPSSSPIHDHVASILIKTPNASTSDIQTGLQQFGGPPVPDSLINTVASQVRQGYKSGQSTAGLPPTVAQGLTPVSAGSYPPPPQQIAAALNPTGPQTLTPAAPAPNSLGPTPTAGRMAAIGAQQSAMDAPPGPPPNFPPAVAAQQQAPGAPGQPPPQTTAPGPPPNPNTDANPDGLTARMDTLEKYNLLGDQGSPPPTSPAPTPAQPVKAHDNRFEDGFKRFLPAALVAALTYKNPGAGSAILGGLQQGQQQLDARQAQQNALATTAKQQATENSFKQADVDNARAKIAADLSIASDKDATQKEIQASKDTAVKALTQSISKVPNKADALTQIQAIDPTDRSGLVASLTAHQGDDNPYYSDAEKATHDRATETTAAALAGTAQQKADQAGQLIGPKIAQIQAMTGYDIDHGNYLKLTGPARVAVYNATAKLLGLNAGNADALAQAKEYLDYSVGSAAGVNAGAHVTSSNAAASQAQTAANKTGASGGPTPAVLNQVYHNYLAPQKGAFGVTTPAPLITDQDGNLMANPKFPDKDGANNALNEAVGQLGGRYFGRNAPLPVNATPSRSATWATLSPDPSYGGNYRQIIVNTAKKYNVDPAAVQAIIKQETGGQNIQGSRNPNGTIDYGIMQVNSATKDPSSYNWKDPATNIDAGVAEFAQKLKAAGGDYHKAFHLYNGLGAPASKYADPVYNSYTALKTGGSRAPITVTAAPGYGGPTLKPTPSVTAMKPIGNGIALNTATGEYYKNGQPTGHFRGQANANGHT